MADDQQGAQSTSSRRRAGPKPFPVLTIESLMPLAQTILNEGVSGQLLRLTLFDRLNRSPDSSSSRQMITQSGRYGLTTGSYQAETISLTESGVALASEAPAFSSTRRLLFESAIERFPPFLEMYNKLRNQRVPAGDVLINELGKIGIDTADCNLAADVFLSNARYIGLIRERSGTERVLPIEHILEEVPPAASAGEAPTTASVEPEPSTPVATVPTSPATVGPSLHIDVQVHIDSSATPEQIDQIFASMSKHLYGKND